MIGKIRKIVRGVHIFFLFIEFYQQPGIKMLTWTGEFVFSEIPKFKIPDF